MPPLYGYVLYAAAALRGESFTERFLTCMPEARARLLSETQLLLNLFERNALGLWNHRLHPNQLQHHHSGKERKHITWRQSRNHLGKESGERCSEDPVRETAQSLAFRAMAVGENFGDENPDHRSLSNRVCGNERENADRHNGVVLGEKSPGHKSEREDVAERSDVEKSPAAEPVNQP